MFFVNGRGARYDAAETMKPLLRMGFLADRLLHRIRLQLRSLPTRSTSVETSVRALVAPSQARTSAVFSALLTQSCTSDASDPAARMRFAV